MLYRYALFAALCTWLLIITGAIVTSYQPASPTTPESLADRRVVAQIAERQHLQQIHTIAAVPVLAVMLGLAVWLQFGKNPGWMRWLGWSTLTALILEGGLGEAAIRQGAAASFSHAYLAQLSFSATVAIAVFTSPGWNRAPELVDDRFSLRTMSLCVPALLLLQVALGAAYRHNAMGVGILTHIFGAFIVAIFVLLVGVLAVKQYPGHSSIRPSAITLMSITGAQVLLGFTAFVLRLMTNQATPAVVVSTVAHVTTGALTLATSVVLMIQIRRHVRRREV